MKIDILLGTITKQLLFLVVSRDKTIFISQKHNSANRKELEVNQEENERKLNSFMKMGKVFALKITNLNCTYFGLR